MGIFDRFLGPSEVEKLKEKRDVEGLIKKLETGGNKERATAAYALGEIGDEKAIAPLIKLLEQIGTDGDVCIAIVKALGQIGDDRALEALIRALSDNIRGRSSPIGYMELPVSLAAAHALKSIGERAVEPLIKALGSESGCMKVYARRALEMIGEPAVKPLTKALENEDKNVRETAKQILKDIQKQPIPPPPVSPPPTAAAPPTAPPPKNKYCIKCGADMPFDAKFCPKCGATQ